MEARLANLEGYVAVDLKGFVVENTVLNGRKTACR